MEKIDILVKVANNNNIDLIMSELKEYCYDIDLDFVRKSVKAVGLVSVKVERCAKRGVEIMMDIIKQEGAETAFQEAVVVSADIFRRYPGEFEVLIKELCKNYQRIHESEPKSSMIWIIGEYAEKIDQVEDLLSYFNENFLDQTPRV